MFGNNKPSLFGSSTTSAFGQPTSSAFGQSTGVNPFGQQQTQQTSLFGSGGNAFGSSTNTFGGGATTGLFGQQQSTSLFGNTNTSTGTTFGTANTNAFNTSTSLFGSGQQQQSAGLFGQSRFGAAASSPFGSTLGSSMQGATGTTVKFNPVTGTDSMMRNGVSTTISTRHQCITCMKEYELKSLEELRLEDYQANRKGPQPGSTGLFGASSTPSSIFGSTTGQNTSFGTSNAGLFGQKPFGQTTTTTSSTTSLFGSFQQPKPATSLFGNTTTPGFGSTLQTNTMQPQQPSLFGQTSTAGTNMNQGSFFSQPNQTNTATVKPFPFGQTATNQTPVQSLFGTTPNLNTGLGAKSLFGNTTSSTPAFGATSNTFNTPNTGTLFSTSQPSFFNQPTSTAQPTKSLFPSFNTQTGNTFGTSNTGQNLFGTPSFGTNTGTSLFGAPQTGTSLFGTSQNAFQTPSFGQQTTLGATQPIMTQNQPTNDQLLLRFQTLPYGDNPLFQFDISVNRDGLAKTTFTTDPKTLYEYKISAKSSEKKPQKIANNPSRTVLFDGLEEEADEYKSPKDIFVPRRNIKKLVLKPKSSFDVTANDSSFLRSPIKDTSSLNESNSFPDTTINELFTRREKTTPKSAEKENPKPRLSSSCESSTAARQFSDSIQENSEDENEESQHKEYTMHKCGVIQTRLDYYTIPTLEELDGFCDESTDTCFVDDFTLGRHDYGSIYWPGPIDVKGLNLDEIVHIRRKEVIVYPDDYSKPPEGEGLNRPAQVTLHQVWPVDKTTKEIIKDPERLKKIKYSDFLEKTTIKQNASFKEYRFETGTWVFIVKHFSKYGLASDDAEVEETTTSSQTQTQTKQIEEFSPKRVTESDINMFERDKLEELSLLFKQQQQQQLWYTFGSEQEDFEIENSFDYESQIFGKNTIIKNAMRSCLFDDIEEDEERKEVQMFKKQKFPEKMSPIQALYTPIVVPPVKLTLRKKRAIKYDVNQFSAKNKIFVDINSVCGASPKISFFRGSKNFVMIKDGNVLICDLKLIDSDVTVARFNEQLKDNSLVASASDHDSFITPYIETRKFVHNSHNSADLEDLIKSLFGKLGEETSYACHQERLSYIQKWLFAYNKKLALPTKTAARIIHFLSTNELQAAVSEALNSNQPRLALLIACGTNINKDLIIAQLDSWKTSESDKFIDEEIIKIYVLFSGQTKWRLSDGKEINILESLKWTQQLALMLLYSSVLEMSEGGNILQACFSQMTLRPDDVEYHLLAYSASENSLPWKSLSAASNIMEMWFLHESLRSFNVITDESDYITQSDAIHCAFVSQLDDIPWACFVALHIKNDSIRELLLKELLTRNADQLENEEITEWLVKNLSIPNEFIAEAKAIRAKSLFDYSKEALNLLECGDWEAAHDVLIDHVFPELVIVEQHDLIKELLGQIAPHSGRIPQWTVGGHIYSQFLRCLDQPTVESVELFNIHHLKCSTKRHVLCQSEMSRRVNIIYSQLSGGTFSYNTPIPDDFVLSELKTNAKNLAETLFY